MQQQGEVIEQPIMFSSAASALGWADSIIAVGRCDSQLFRIMRDAMQQNNIRPTNGVTLEDLRCAAHDISIALRDVQPYENACVFRHLFGLPSGHESMQAVLRIAERLEPEAEGMRRVKVRALALAALNSEKQGMVDRRFYSVSRFARSVGVTRQTFTASERWMELRGLAVREVKSMIEAAEKRFAERLRYKGLM